MDYAIVRREEDGLTLHATGYNRSGLATGYAMFNGQKFEFEGSVAGMMRQRNGTWNELPDIDKAPLYDPKKDQKRKR